MRYLDSIIDPMDMSLSKLWELMKDRKPGLLQSMGCKESDMTEQQQYKGNYRNKSNSKIMKRTIQNRNRSEYMRNFILLI